jgi:adenosylhomocysteine nucleosidase
MKRAAIIAAMAGELKPLVRDWEHERRNSVDLWRRRLGQGWCVAACAGAGLAAAARAFGEAEKDGAVDAVVSIGWAGALSEELRAGQIYQVSGVIDARTGERFRAEGFEAVERDGDWLAHPSDKNKDVARMGQPPGSSAERNPGSLHRDGRDLGHPGVWLVTSPKVADEAEKRRLAAAYGTGVNVGLVDMEAAGVARLAAMRGIPFYCVKGVSDGLHDKLPDFNRFISTGGQFQLVRFVLFVLIRPWHWPGLMRMGENSRKAALGIRELLLENLDRMDKEL